MEAEKEKSEREVQGRFKGSNRFKGSKEKCEREVQGFK
jgi:hypothetical protein